MPADRRRRLPDAEFARRVLIALGLGRSSCSSGASSTCCCSRSAPSWSRSSCGPPRSRSPGARPLPEAWAIPLVAALIVAGLGLVASLIGAEVRAQVAELVPSVPSAWEALRENVAGSAIGQQLANQVGSAAAAPDVGGVLAGVTGAASSALGAVTNTALVVFGGLYLAAQPRFYADGLLKLVPPAGQPNVAATLAACG